MPLTFRGTLLGSSYPTMVPTTLGYYSGGSVVVFISIDGDLVVAGPAVDGQLDVSAPLAGMVATERLLAADSALEARLVGALETQGLLAGIVTVRSLSEGEIELAPLADGATGLEATLAAPTPTLEPTAEGAANVTSSLAGEAETEPEIDGDV